MRAKTDTPSSLDIGLLLYPGVQRAAVHGLADLFLVANRVAAELGGVGLPTIRVSFWQADELGRLLPAPDSPADAGLGLRVLIIPPSLESAPQAELLERHRALLCQLHVQGTVLASVCIGVFFICLLYTSPSPRDRTRSRMPSSA